MYIVIRDVGLMIEFGVHEDEISIVAGSEKEYDSDSATLRLLVQRFPKGTYGHPISSLHLAALALIEGIRPQVEATQP